MEGLIGDSEIERVFNEDPEIEETETLRHFVEVSQRVQVEKSFFESVMNLIDNAKLGLQINHMIWEKLDLGGSNFPLLTSDRPVVRTNYLDLDQSHIAIPIGPRSVFVAVNNEETLNRVRSSNPTQVARELNLKVVENARSLVFAQNDQQKAFINKNFGRNRQPDIITLSTDIVRL